MRRRAVVWGVAAVLLGACKKDSSGPQGPLAGHWVGSTSEMTLDYTLRDEDGGLLGTGTASGSAITGGSIGFDAAGSRANSQFSLRLTAAGKLAVDLSGTLTNDTTTGVTLNGSGFSSYGMTLYKQH